MNELSKEDLEKLTSLSRIMCTPEEQERLLKDLRSILNYVSELQEVNTDLTLGKHNPLECSSNVMQEDVPEPSLEREEFLENCPHHVGGMVRIPPVIQF